MATGRSVGELMAVGIDLGSENARVSIIAQHTSSPSIIADPQTGLRSILAISALEETPNQYIFGDAAHRHLIRSNPKSSSGDLAKKFVRRLSSVGDEGEEESQDNALDKNAASAFFEYLGEMACRSYSSSTASLLRIVISAPSSFSEQERQGVVQCCRAGIKNLVGKMEGKKKKKKFGDEAVIGVLTDAAAVCVAHGLTDVVAQKDRANGDSSPKGAPKSWKNCLIVDWGKSGLTLTTFQNFNNLLIRTYINHNPSLTNHLLLTTLLQHIKTQFERKYRVTIPPNSKQLLRLETTLKNALRTFERANVVPIHMDEFYEGYDLNVSVTRPRFESLCQPVLKQVENALIQVPDYQSLDIVLSSGSACQMPFFVSLIEKLFPCVWKGNDRIPVDECVAIGCSKYAHQILTSLSQQEAASSTSLSTHMNKILPIVEMEVPVSPISILASILTEPDTKGDNIALIPKGTPLPANVTKLLSTPTQKNIVQLLQRNHPNEEQQQEDYDDKVLLTVDPCGMEQLTFSIELSVDGKLSLRVNDGDKVTL